MTTSPLPSPTAPNPDRLRDFLSYIAEVLMDLDGIKVPTQGEMACTSEVLEVTSEPATS